jgi:hypothetical protein
MNVITSVTTTSAQVREYLTAGRTYYVRTDGNDSNNGLANTPAGAFLTIQHAVDVVCTAIDINSQIVTIQVVDGTYNYNAAVVLKDYVGIGPIWLQGNTTTPANVPLSVTGASAIIATSGNWVIKGFSITSTGANSDGISVDGLARVTYTQVNFGACGRYHVFGSSGATVIGTGAYSISGGGYGHLGGGANTRIGLSSATVTVTGTPAFTTFALATFASTMEFYSTTFSGAATGKRYEATLNAVIYTSAGGANFFPGDSAGTTTTGGQYA